MGSVHLKRIAAVILALPLLQLNVARAAIACDRHGGDGTAKAAASAHDSHAMHGPRAQHAATDEIPLGDTTRPEECEAMASCSFVFGAEDAQPLAGGIVVRESRLSASASAPRSRISAPEPPPPKAQLDF
jgi:hypothetical protein